MHVICKACKLSLLLVLLAAAVSTFLNHDRERLGTWEIRSRYDLLVMELNGRGRLPLTGYVGGEINNLYQIARHPGHPERLGCGDQAQFVSNRLNGIPGWHFEVHYAYGTGSPIILPHQWVEGQGPNGLVVEIDPWSDVFMTRK